MTAATGLGIMRGKAAADTEYNDVLMCHEINQGYHYITIIRAKNVNNTSSS